MAIRVVKFPILINQTSDAESIRRFDDILKLSTELWNSFSIKFKEHYLFNKENNTFHYEKLPDKDGKLKKTKVKHSDYKPDVNQSFCENEAKEFFKDKNVHSHLQQEVAMRFALATQKSFKDFKEYPKNGFHPPKQKQSFEDYKSLRFKQKQSGYKLNLERNEVSFNFNEIKFNFIGDDYHKNIIKNNEERFVLIKKEKDKYTLCVYIKGEFEFVPNSNSLNIQYKKPYKQSLFSKKLLNKIAKLNNREQNHIKNIKNISKRKNKTISKLQPIKNQNDILNHAEGVIGIDPGCGYSNTLSLSNGLVYNFSDSHYSNIERLEYNKEKLKRKIVNSKSYSKLNKLIEKQETHIANYRLDWLHKVAKQLVQSYNTIALEDFHSKDFVEENSIRFLNKQTMNASFGSLKTFIAYKSKMANKNFILINPEYTSQICSNPDCCKSYENFNKKNLKDRTHKCECGLCLDRDLNSAINILLLATNEKFKTKFDSIVEILKSQKQIKNEPRNGLGDCYAISENETVRSSATTEAQGL